jgi:DNA-binding NarL/FixJ family response regulator
MKEKPLMALLRCKTASKPRLLPPSDGVHVGYEGAFDAEALVRIHAMRPAVVLLDLRGLAGSPAAPIAAVRAAAPDARVVVVGTPFDETMAEAALVAGVSGYLSRDLSEAAILSAISRTAGGNLHLTQTGRRAVKHLVESAKPAK